MINTLDIKLAQLQNGFFTVGSGKEIMLIMGSCRVAPYVEYFDRWNVENDNRFTIHSLDPFNFHWNIEDKRVNYDEALTSWETDERMLNMLKSVDYFIHEWYENSGMFNCFIDGWKNIYQFGMEPKFNICLPNWNDVFVLFNDIVKFDLDLRRKATQDIAVIGKISEKIQNEIAYISKGNLEKFYNICLKSDVPEMAIHVLENIKQTRFFHSYNHVSKYFTLAIFKYINDKFLNLTMPDDFIKYISKEDMFDNSFTRLTEYDKLHFGYDWGEETAEISL